MAEPRLLDTASVLDLRFGTRSARLERALDVNMCLITAAATSHRYTMELGAQSLSNLFLT